MSLADDLRAVKAVIDTPEKWTKGAGAIDKTGARVAVKSSSAVCWCAMGALTVALPSAKSSRRWVKALEAINKAADTDDIAGFNDHPDTTHDDVMALFDRAIERAEA